MLHPAFRLGASVWMATVGVVVMSSCAPDIRLRDAQQHQPLEAECTVDVIGTGIVDMETDYLPHVITCENGAADFAALQAQAVAARSYAYYKIGRGEPIADGTSDQVYSCGAEPTQLALDAVASTAGEVLRYHDTQVAAFYVAGAVPSDVDACIAVAGDNDYSSTEHYVTNNWGRAGAGLEQTTLGWVHEENWANRGCKSQNGAHCLAEAGWGYEDILLFYYGMDIVREQTTGSCAPPLTDPHGCGVVVDEAGDAGVVIEEDDLCAIQGCASDDALTASGSGHDDGHLQTPSTDDADCFHRWRFSVDNAADLEVQVFLPDVEVVFPSTLRYDVHTTSRSVSVDIDTAERGWVSLGTFAFDVGNLTWVELASAQGAGGQVPFDALWVGPEGQGPADDFVDVDGGVSPADGGVGAPDAGEAGVDAGGPVDDDDLPPSVVRCACSTSHDGSAGAAALLGVWIVLLRRRRS